mgnify:FL=1
MNIGIDIDDTISNTYDFLFNYAQKYTIIDKNKEIKNVNRNAITHMYTTTFHNWTDEEEKEFLNKYYEKIIKEVKPKMYAVEIINKLKAEGHKIYLITARFKMDNININLLTQKWVEENNIQYDKLIIDAQNKLEIAKENNIDIFIDDSIKNCETIANDGKIKTFIFDSIVNINYKNEKITRVYSWPHLYQEIQKIIKNKEVK